MVQLQQRDPFKTIFKYFKCYGMWTEISVKHRILSIAAFLLLNLSCCILIILSLLNAGNIDEFARCTIYGSVYLISLTCVINLNMKKKEIQGFIDDFNQVMDDDHDVMNVFIENGLKKCNRMYNVTFRVGIFIIGTGTIVGPLIFGHVEMPMWFLSDPRLFYATWIFQFVSSFYTIYLSVFNIEMFCNSLIMIHSYIKYFEHNLRNIKWKDKNEILRCIKIHWNILRLMEKVENIIHYPFVAIGFFGMTVLCFIAFQLSNNSIFESKNLPMFIHYGGRKFVLTAQMFRACYFSQQIQSSSEEFIHNLYESDWIKSDHKFKKIMLIFNENLKQPISMRIFKTIHVNLETFQSILNVVYSLYTLLKNLKH